jgi:hypothetical protein
MWEEDFLGESYMGVYASLFSFQIWKELFG